MNTPSCYLSRTPSGWSLIYQESPLCDYKKTRAEAEAVARQFKVQPSPHFWNGSAGQFEPLDPHQEAEAAAFSLMPTPNQPKTTAAQTPLF